MAEELIAFSMVCGSVVILGGFWFLRHVLELRQQKRIPIALEGLQARLERIEQIVDATAVEVERISEANRFMSKVLAERMGPVGLPTKQERVVTPH